MWRNFRWEKTARIQQLLVELEAFRLVFQSLPSRPQREENLRKASLLKSAVYSARIEGAMDTETNPRLESHNLLSIYRQIYKSAFPKVLTPSFIKRLHKEALRRISPGGSWRQEPWAVFNQAGIAIHIAPGHVQLPKMMGEYTTFVNRLSESIPIKAATAQFIFEKIHPLPDGNGRVGRLISAFVLYNGGYGFRGQIPLEEYIERHREEYYEALEPSKNMTQFVEFFLTALVKQGKEIMKKLNAMSDEQASANLMPRREEVYRIIKDHPNCSFDFIRRRFMAVSASTLHRDIAHLVVRGFVRKRGATSGAVYLAANDLS